MEMFSFTDTTFTKEDFRYKTVQGVEYEACVFDGCIFGEADLSDAVFIDCSFKECDLSNAKLAGTSFRDCTFTGCRMLGLHFGECNGFGLSMKFERSILDHSTFHDLKLPKTVFRETRVIEADFSGSDLSGSLFDECDLSGSTFSHVNLERVDFRTSRNFLIDPESNRIGKARFSVYGIAGLLNKYDIDIEM